MRFDGKNTKQKATVIKMDELSGVTVPAHGGATVSLMKSGDIEEMKKNLFLEAVEHMELQDEIYDIIWKVWDYTDALHDVALDIMYNQEKYPNPGEAFAEVLKSFAGVVSTLKKNKDDEGAKDAVTAFVKVDKLHVLKIIQKSKSAAPATNLSKGKDMKTKEELAAEVELKKKADAATLERLTALSKMSDKQKSHNDTLSDDESQAFLKMDSAAMDATILAKEAGNALVYTAKNGMKFFQNDDERLITMAKEADASAEKAVTLEKAAEVTRLEKQAEIELGGLPGESADKVALLKAIETGIPDVLQQVRIMKMFAAQNEGFHKAEEVQGHQLEKQRGDANEQLKTLAKSMASDENIEFNAAFAKVIETPEGKELYEQIA